MLSPQGEAAARREPSDPLEVPPDALVERLQRRIAALERQLEARIAQVTELQSRLLETEHQHRVAAEEPAQALAEADALRHKAAEYDALMATLTMRALRRPRAWYGQARRRLSR